MGSRIVGRTVAGFATSVRSVVSFALVLLAAGAGASGNAVSAAGAAVAEGEYAPRAGEPHPPLELPTIEHDRIVRLSDYRGKKVLLIHFASW